MKYLEDASLRFTPEECCRINPNVFFTPCMNFIASFSDDMMNFYSGLSFANKNFLPTRSRLYYAFHPLEARREMNSCAYKTLFVKGLLGFMSPVYYSAKFLKTKLKCLKERLYYLVHAKHICRAFDLALNYEIVSFDVFNTLIFRTCKTIQIFMNAEKKYNACHNMKIELFTDKRIEAQKLAGMKSYYGEITLDEIYDELADEYGSNAEDIRNAEIESELEAAYPNEEMKRFYDHLIRAGKRIIITSDMYLPHDVIAGILERCGYEGYESLYVSSEYRARKSSGELFRKIINDKRVKPSMIMHIGDNLNSDYIMALREGIKGFLYKK